MAKTITQRIALEGGAEFRKGLEDLGKAGQQAFQNVQNSLSATQTLAQRIAPSIAALQARFEAMRNAGANVATSFRNVGTSFQSAARNLALLGGAVLGANGGFIALAISSARSAEELQKAAAAAGLSVEEYQKLSGALSLVGVDANELGGILNKMNRTFGEARKSDLQLQKAQRDLSDDFINGKISSDQYQQSLIKLQKTSTEQINVFTRLGINAKDAMDNPREALLQLADAFGKLPTGIEKSALELEIFGRTGTRAALALNQGRAGIVALEKEFQRVAPAFTNIELQARGKLKDAFELLAAAANNLRLRIFDVFAPTLAGLVNGITEAIVRNREAFIQFAQAIITALQPVIARVTEFINSITIDPEKFEQIIETLGNFASDLGTAIGIIIAAWNALVAVLDQVAGIINSIFGTKLSGQALAIAAAILTVTGVVGAFISALGAVLSLIGLLVAAFGGINVAIVAAGIAIGFFLGKQLPELIEGLVVFFQDAANAIVQLWTDIGQTLQDSWDATIQFFTDRWNEFRDLILQGLTFILDKLKSVAKFFGFGGGDESNQDTGLAGGGYVRGRGTATSDSIRAWLSNGEFVIRAKAVQHYGASFFSALNNMRLQRGDFGFAMGGLVSALEGISKPQRTHFATGGLVEASTVTGPTGRPVILKIGDATFGPMIAGERTVTQLERFVASKQMRSQGRKPTWDGS